MRTILVGLLAAAGIAIATPVVPASAQVIVDTPVGGVRVGHDRGYYRDYDIPGTRLRSRLPHYHHPPRRRIFQKNSALRLSITDVRGCEGWVLTNAPGPFLGP